MLKRGPRAKNLPFNKFFFTPMFFIHVKWSWATFDILMFIVQFGFIEEITNNCIRILLNVNACVNTIFIATPF